MQKTKSSLYCSTTETNRANPHNNELKPGNLVLNHCQLNNISGWIFPLRASFLLTPWVLEIDLSCLYTRLDSTECVVQKTKGETNTEEQKKRCVSSAVFSLDFSVWHICFHGLYYVFFKCFFHSMNRFWLLGWMKTRQWKIIIVNKASAGRLLMLLDNKHHLNSLD